MTEPPIISIREEQPKDSEEILRIHEQTFSRRNEAKLVKTLCGNNLLRLSLLAVRGKHALGHILFTQVWIIEDSRKVEGMGLAPLAVLPEFQRQGTGTLLVHYGLKLLMEGGCSYVIVLGSPGYYSRFCFKPAYENQVKCPWEVLESSFQLLVLNPAKPTLPNGTRSLSSRVRWTRMTP